MALPSARWRLRRTWRREKKAGGGGVAHDLGEIGFAGGRRDGLCGGSEATSSAVKDLQSKLDVVTAECLTEKEKLKEMVLALLDESDLDIASDAVEMIVDRTFDQADTKGDGKIDQEEWTEYAKDNPYVLRNMTLPYLKDITMVFPSFVMHLEISETDMAV
ncbi:Calcineurin B-like protein 5 [Zea mays]|uniref:Calcineurin B-like protein n=1 Tax=Zea mays TaxID=4577 RepID=A0A317YE52_MAIZE|nr:Calcineurin B-like protein 5 [Zea mays]